MKRKGNLIEPIAEMTNLELAFYKAQKGKSAKPQVCHYRKDLTENLKQLQEQILSGNVVVGNYNYFTIYDVVNDFLFCFFSNKSSSCKVYGDPSWYGRLLVCGYLYSNQKKQIN